MKINWNIFKMVSKTAPALFDGNDDSKILEFCTDKEDFKLYVKYSGKPTSTSNSKTNRWNIAFTKKDIETLEHFEDLTKKVYVVLICGVRSLAKTEIAIIDLKDALKCLGNDDINKQKRITVKHNKGERSLIVYGTMLDGVNAIKVPKNFNKFFAIEQKEE